MSARDVALALVTVVIWGLAFVATRIGLDSFSPPQLVTLRFLIALTPALFLAPPKVPWPLIIAAGLTLYTGQFLFQFFGIANGMPPGLASLIVQTQALFTVLFAALFLYELPKRRQTLGLLVSFAGLAVIGTTAGDDLSPHGFALTLISPISFGIGNVLLKHIGATASLALMSWMAIVPPLPATAISLWLDGPDGFRHAIVTAPWLGWAAVLYLGVFATVLAYTIWGSLLRRYPVATVTPFALLVPFVGALSSALVFGERFGPVRVLGMALVLAGLTVILTAGRRTAMVRSGAPERDDDPVTT
jgi:O-acetylserine/cysteine efflux transporter